MRISLSPVRFPSVFLFIGLLLAFLQAYPLPDKGKIVVCLDSTCLQTTIANILSVYQERDVLFVAFASQDFSKDSYLSLYIGWIVDQFDGMPGFKDVFFLLYQSKKGIMDGAVSMISLLPSQSVFIAYEHGFSSFSIYNLEHLKRKTGKGPAVVFHLNHEQPWEFKNKNSLDFTFSTLDGLISSYALHPLVIRNYYYQPLLNYSHYYPVGPTLYGYMIANSSSVLQQSQFKLSSERKRFCYFIGRTNYSVIRAGELTHVPATEAHVRDRMELVKLSKEVF